MEGRALASGAIDSLLHEVGNVGLVTATLVPDEIGEKERDGYWKWFAGNLVSGGAAGASSLLFVYYLNLAHTHLANDAKAAKKRGGGQLASNGIVGLYRGFSISGVGIIVYRGLYFGMYDSLKPVLLTGDLQDSFFASFALGWLITNGAGLASYLTVRRRMMLGSDHKSSKTK